VVLIQVLWDTTICRLESSYHHFAGVCCLYGQHSTKQYSRKSLLEFIRTWRQKAAQKCHYFTVQMVSHTKQLDCSYISL